MVQPINSRTPGILGGLKRIPKTKPTVLGPTQKAIQVARSRPSQRGSILRSLELQAQATRARLGLG